MKPPSLILAVSASALVLSACGKHGPESVREAAGSRDPVAVETAHAVCRNAAHMLTSKDIDAMVAGGQDITDPKEKIKRAEQMAFYGSDAGLDVLQEILEVPFSSKGLIGSTGVLGENESNSSYGPASTQPSLNQINPERSMTATKPTLERAI